MRTAGLGCWLLVLLAGGLGAEAADEPAEIKAVLDKAVKALGGETALNQFRAATWKGTVTFRELGRPVRYQGEWALQPPEQARMVMTGVFDGQKFQRELVINGDQGWTRTADVTEEMDRETLTEDKERLYAAWIASVAPLREQDFQISWLGESKVNKQATVGLQVAQAGHRDVKLYFDKKNGLVLKSETRIKDRPDGTEHTLETFYSDYQEFGGVKHAMRVKVKVDGKPGATAEFTDFQPREKLESSLFARPP